MIHTKRLHLQCRGKDSTNHAADGSVVGTIPGDKPESRSRWQGTMFVNAEETSTWSFSIAKFERDASWPCPCKSRQAPVISEPPPLAYADEKSPPSRRGFRKIIAIPASAKGLTLPPRSLV